MKHSEEKISITTNTANRQAIIDIIITANVLFIWNNRRNIAFTFWNNETANQLKIQYIKNKWVRVFALRPIFLLKFQIRLFLSPFRKRIFTKVDDNIFCFSRIFHQIKMSKSNEATEEEYSVEKVLNRRVRNGKVSYSELLYFSFVFYFVVISFICWSTSKHSSHLRSPSIYISIKLINRMRLVHSVKLLYVFFLAQSFIQACVRVVCARHFLETHHIVPLQTIFRCGCEILSLK